MATLSTIKKRGLTTYSSDGLSNINLGLSGFDILSNGFATNETRYPCSGNGLDGALVHEAIITDDGEVPTYNDGSEDYTATIINFGGINAIVTTFQFGVGFAAETTGVLAPNTWIKVNDEIMWISAIVGINATVTRGQMGTSAATHGSQSTIRTLGLTPSVITEAFKVPCGYWKAIKCISTNLASMSVNIQVSGAYDDLTIEHLGNSSYDPQENARFVPMGEGDIIYGQFNRVAIDEPADPAPATPPAENVAKLMLIRG